MRDQMLGRVEIVPGSDRDQSQRDAVEDAVGTDDRAHRLVVVFECLREEVLYESARQHLAEQRAAGEGQQDQQTELPVR